jgi:hypothetical protein
VPFKERIKAKMPSENILKEIIEGYRLLIDQRYQYHNLTRKFDIPDFITEETVDQIRAYFLNYIYPDYNKREELNEAFESLDTYIKRPEKLLRMLMDSITLLFSHGMHLPKILSTGMKALKSFRAASSFENKLAEEAVRNDMRPPYDRTKINTLLKSLSLKEVDEFIEISESMVFIFRDQTLIKEVKEILEYLIGRMKAKRDLYAHTEVRGIELGLEMLVKGEALFNRFSLKDQETLIHLIIEIERSFLNSPDQ